jgi:hypothetical protein
VYRSHELRAPKFQPPQKFIARTLEELATSFDVTHSRQDASALLEQRWQGSVQASGTNAVVRRRMTLLEDGLVRSRRAHLLLSSQP